jgi:beta-glucosidase
MKQKSKKTGIIGIVIAVVLVAVLIVVDVLCSVYSGFISLYFKSSAEGTEEATAAVSAANDFTVTQEAEGLVLMKNDNNTLPLKTTTKVNLFGACSVKQLYIGTGSAAAWNWDSETFVNLKQALKSEGIEANETLWNFYESLSTTNNSLVGGVTDMQGSTHNIVDPNISDYSDGVLSNAKNYSDTAIIVIGRAGGEGSDAVMDMTPTESTKINGDAGKHYLELQSNELSMVDYVKANYSHVILLVNTPMPVELGFVDDKIDSVMWIGLPGQTGNTAVAQAIKGTISPSGRLSDTWAYEVESAPSYYNFGDYTYSNSELTSGNNKYVHYQEGIYVGYRWYETANAEGVTVTASNYNNESKKFNFTNYSDIVQYSFGQGLSYTTFKIEWDGTPTLDSSNNFNFKVKVTNTGSTASKTPVEIYCEQPYTSGGIEKSKVVLAGFAKTDLLQPNASQTVTITVARDDLSSYDSVTAKAYVLDAGDYKFYADYGKYGSHCWANTSDSNNVLNYTYNLSSKITFNTTARSSDLTVATNQFDDVAQGDGIYTPVTDDLSRASFATTFPTSYNKTNNEANSQTVTRLTDNVQGATLQGYNAATYRYEGEFGDANGKYKDPTSGYTALSLGQSNGLGLADLVGIEATSSKWDDLISQMSWREIQQLICNCGWQNPAIASIKKTAGVDMDGAEGLHDLVNGTSTNCYTCSPITASSFNVDVAYQMGDTYAQECIAYNVTGMYGFSMNTHRSPFGGRAFEYYSEDGVLAGKIAAAATSGLQDNGVTVYSKHFALNDQETNRSGVHTWASEQAIREIYLRPFEIVTKTATAKSSLLHGSTGIMTAYSSLGTSHVSAHYPLLTNVLRGEWGFNGRVLTDAFGWDSVSCSVRAGTDMMLGFTTFDTVSGMDNSTGYGLAAAQRAVKDQIFVFANSNGISTDSGISNAWIAIPICVSIVLAAAAVVVVIFMVIPAFKKKKSN